MLANLQLPPGTMQRSAVSPVTRLRSDLMLVGENSGFTCGHPPRWRNVEPRGILPSRAHRWL